MSTDYFKIINDLTGAALDRPGRTTAELRLSIAANASSLSLEQTPDNSRTGQEFIPKRPSPVRAFKKQP